MRFAFLLVFSVAAAGASPALNSEYSRYADSNSRSAVQVYGKFCASCHGRDGHARTAKGRARRARDLSESDWQNSVTDERIFNSIVNGKRKMPAYGKKLSDQEIDSLVSYVRALHR